MDFKTEKEIEQLLAPLTRTINRPGEHARNFSMMKVYWDAFDYILGRLSTLDSLLAETQRLARVHRLDPDTALAYQVTKLYRWGAEELKIKVPFPPPVCPLAHIPKVPRR